MSIFKEEGDYGSGESFMHIEGWIKNFFPYGEKPG